MIWSFKGNWAHLSEIETEVEDSVTGSLRNGLEIVAIDAKLRDCFREGPFMDFFIHNESQPGPTFKQAARQSLSVSFTPEFALI